MNQLQFLLTKKLSAKVQLFLDFEKAFVEILRPNLFSDFIVYANIVVKGFVHFLGYLQNKYPVINHHEENQLH
jgi:hypothetical protein